MTAHLRVKGKFSSLFQSMVQGTDGSIKSLHISCKQTDEDIRKLSGAYSADIRDAGAAVNQHKVIFFNPLSAHIFYETSQIMLRISTLPIQRCQLIPVTITANISRRQKIKSTVHFRQDHRFDIIFPVIRMLEWFIITLSPRISLFL